MGTAIVGGIILLAVVMVLRSIINNKKKGNLCSGGCSGCSMQSAGCSSEKVNLVSIEKN